VTEIHMKQVPEQRATGWQWPVAFVIVAVAMGGIVGGRGSALKTAKTMSGVVEGMAGSDDRIGVFRGIPYAAAPVGALRWQPPHPPASWQGTRKAVTFGPRCMQANLYSDMVFRDEPSEDCLYLNVWTPALSPSDRLPVMVWIHGGGFQAGSSSEPRQDGERLASKGVVVVSMNYRMGAFGFLAHPDLTKEASPHASGNYGLLDMVAALGWVKANIAVFGGNPSAVTIFGESAGSFAVSALMAAPAARDLFHRAIGESGAYFAFGKESLLLQSRTESEARGLALAKALNAESSAALRAASAADVLKAAGTFSDLYFSPNVDGHLLTADVAATFGAGRQSHVPLLAGWNADEVRADVVLAKDKPNARAFADQVRVRFGTAAESILNVYPAGSDAEALESASTLAGDLFMGHPTWKWLETHAATGRAAVYRYSFDRKIPVAPDERVNGVPATSADIGARHAGDIEYVFGTLTFAVPRVSWTADDERLSDQMMSYWSNFAKRGDPNAEGLPAWPPYQTSDRKVQHLDVTIRSSDDTARARLLALDAYATSVGKKN